MGSQRSQLGVFLCEAVISAFMSELQRECKAKHREAGAVYTVNTVCVGPGSKKVTRDRKKKG